MTAVRSIYTVSMGGVDLLAVNDLLWGELEEILKLTPQFAGVEEVLMVGGAARTFERGNRMHRLEFARVRVHSDVMEALKFQLMHPGGLPAGGQDVTLTIDGYLGSRVLYRASIVDAPIFTHHHLSITSYTIVGGALSGSINLTADILDQAGDDFLAEDTNVLQQE